MQYEDVYRRYGNYIAKRLQTELGAAGFARTDLNNLTHFLENRAELAHRDYKQIIDDPLATPNHAKANQLLELWRDAEDLAYLIVIAESVYGNLTTIKA